MASPQPNLKVGTRSRFHYIALVNSRGGVEGHKIRVLEIDHEYKVPVPHKTKADPRPDGWPFSVRRTSQ
jgi:hypothetical protein